MVTRTKKRLIAALTTLTLLLIGIGVALYANAHWRPLPQGTPTLSPEVEALRDKASSYGLRRPGRHDEWVLIVTFVSEKNVGVSFSRSESGDLTDSYENEPYTLIAVGSSEKVLDCTITVLESHPGRSDNSTALVAVQCPDEAGATHSSIPDTGP